MKPAIPVQFANAKMIRVARQWVIPVSGTAGRWPQPRGVFRGAKTAPQQGNHVNGLAVDIWGWWSDDPNDIWGTQITNIARQFRLDRPFTKAYVNEQNTRLARDNGRTRLQAEYWHFEPVDIERYR